MNVKNQMSCEVNEAFAKEFQNTPQKTGDTQKSCVFFQCGFPIQSNSVLWWLLWQRNIFWKGDLQTVYIEQGQCLHKQSHILATLFQRMFQDSCCYMNKLKTYHSPSDFLRVRGVQHRYRHTSHGLSMGSKCGSYIHARLNQEFVVIPQISLYRWATVWSLQTKQVLNIYNIYQSSLLEERK